MPEPTKITHSLEVKRGTEIDKQTSWLYSPPDEASAETSYTAQRKFFERLEQELEAAKRAGVNYLTVFGPTGDQLYYSINIETSFVPHSDESPEWIECERKWARGRVETIPIGAN